MTHHAGADPHEIADQTTLIEMTRTGVTPHRRVFETWFAKGPELAFKSWNPGAQPIYRYDIFGAILDAKTGFLTKSRMIFGQKSELANISYGQDGPVSDIKILPNEFGKVIVGFNSMYTNYYHWIAQCLPGIVACIASERTRYTVLFPEIHPMQAKFFDIMSLSNVEIASISREGRYYIRDLAFCNLTNGAGSFALSKTARDLYRTVARRVRSRSAPGPAKIYVARTDAWSRKLTNEHDIIALLRAHDYHIVVPGELDIEAQIAIFAHAEIVIGPHGAGLSNIVFCRTQTLVYELIPEHYQNACFCNLAIQADLSYICDAYHSPGEGMPNFRPWEADLRRFAARLAQIEQYHSLALHRPDPARPY